MSCRRVLSRFRFMSRIKIAAIIASVLTIVVTAGLTVAPIPGFLGMDAGALGALEVTIASGLATVLLWYGLRS